MMPFPQMPPAHGSYLWDVGVPVGSVITYVGKLPKSSDGSYEYEIESRGWMVCDDRWLSESQYPELFQAIGNLYGEKADPDNNKDKLFRLPNLSGMFLRGVGKQDLAQYSEEDRTKAAKGEDNGVGSTQKFTLQTHQHLYTMPVKPATITPGEGGAEGVITVKEKTNTSDPVDPNKQKADKVQLSANETRSVNTMVYFLIKYTSHLPILGSPANEF